MTRKHFKALADALQNSRPMSGSELNTVAAQYTWNNSVYGIADVCKRTNPAFRRERFYDACGGLFNLAPEAKDVPSFPAIAA